MTAGRPTKLEQTRREQRLLQLVAAGYTWQQAGEQAGMTAAAVVRFQDHIGLGLPHDVQLRATA